ncbi:hypothetical protein [Cupriavidus basilensis]|uniref:hypothetical protein n=1 Tax=Cupriavidus basilensis TaxID=68895 RepID=UPI0039F6B022
MSDVVLSLGDVTFADTEVPEHILIETGHANVVHKFVGGARKIDMLGADHAPIPWSGLLIGDNALDRALKLKGMNDAGLMLLLSWSEFLYQVVITGFTADFEREYQIPYSITCTVVQDLTGQPGQGARDSMGDLINGDMSLGNALSGAIGDAGLSGAMSSLSSAIGAVSSFATAARSTLNSVLAPLAAAQAQVSTLIASTENTLLSVSTLGGILPNNPISKSVAKISSQINAMQSQANLVQLSGVLGRMGANIGQINSGVKTISVGGGSLFDLASKVYGKVSGWTAISQANPQLKGETQIDGNQNITIPPYTVDSGGVLIA